MPDSLAAQIERYDCYKTRCNICGVPIRRQSYANFFVHEGVERRCCDSCSGRPEFIVRRELWDRQYTEPEVDQPLWRYMENSRLIDLVLHQRLASRNVTVVARRVAGPEPPK